MEVHNGVNDRNHNIKPGLKQNVQIVVGGMSPTKKPMQRNNSETWDKVETQMSEDSESLSAHRMSQENCSNVFDSS